MLSYRAEVSRANPSGIIFLVDQSGSMEDPWGGGEQKRKADGLADAINRLLQNLVIKCSKEEGVRDYYHVAVLGYGDKVRLGLGGSSTERELVPISFIANNPIRVEERVRKVSDGAGGLVEEKVKFPVWFDPLANGGTPMCEAISTAARICSDWVSQHRTSFPPTVINITDGEATDGDPSVPASNLRNVASEDGNALLFNIHISSQKGNPVEYPDSEELLPDQFARLLFRMSSILPDHIRSAGVQQGYSLTERSRGFVFNADMVSLITFLDIGTRPSNLR